MRHAAKKIWMNLSVADKGHQVKKNKKKHEQPFPTFCPVSLELRVEAVKWVYLSLSDTLPLHCCPQHLHGVVTNCPRKSLCGAELSSVYFS